MAVAMAGSSTTISGVSFLPTAANWPRTFFGLSSSVRRRSQPGAGWPKEGGQKGCKAFWNRVVRGHGIHYVPAGQRFDNWAYRRPARPTCDAHFRGPRISLRITRHRPPISGKSKEETAS